MGRSRFLLLTAAAIVAVMTGAPIATAEPASTLKTVDAARLQAVVDAAAADLLVPGAFVLLRTPQGEFTASVGTTELGTTTPPAPDTHFRIASNTKTMTAAVMDADPAKAWTPQEVLALAYAHPPLFAPGAEYDYSNTNYALLGLVAEQVGEAPLAVQFQQRLFIPLELTQTYLPANTDTVLPQPFSHGDMYGGSTYALVDADYPADMQAAALDGSLLPVDYTHQSASYATAAGGAVSTAGDLGTWISALVSGRLFDTATQQQWLGSLIAEDPDAPDGQEYGYGISYQRFGPHAAMYYHGECPAARSAA
ncbi:serine hydrolase domain-containing protein [soil metagenome]